MLSFLFSSGQLVYFQIVSSHSQRFFEIGDLKNFVKLTGIPVQESLVNQPAGYCFFQNETPTQLLYCEFCEFFENNIFTEQLRSAASVYMERICSISKPHCIQPVWISRSKSLEAVVCKCSSKQVFLKISHISQKNLCWSLFLF